MKVQIQKTFPMPSSAAVAWELLRDVESVASCVPGAAITERTDATRYKGNVAVRLGPASMSFRGTVEVISVDEASNTMRLLGKGTDTTGTSGASMDLSVSVRAAPSGQADACELSGVSEVTMSGKAATFGGRMVGAVADQVLKQFAANFANKAQASQARQSEKPAKPAVRRGARAAPVSNTAVSAEPAPVKQLDGLALMRAVIAEWLRAVFQPKKK